MKISARLFGMAIGGLMVLGVGKAVLANEGVLNMKSVPAGSGSCFMASVYVDSTYRVLMTCRDLKLAVTAEENRYVAWVVLEDGKIQRLGEVINGKLSNTMPAKFTKVFITLESDSYSNKPSSNIVMGGDLTGIDFTSGGVSNGVPFATPTPTVVKKITPVVDQTSDVQVKTTSNNSGLGNVLGSIVRIALIGFALLLVIVGVFSFLSRRRSL